MDKILCPRYRAYVTATNRKDVSLYRPILEWGATVLAYTENAKERQKDRQTGEIYIYREAVSVAIPDSEAT